MGIFGTENFEEDAAAEYLVEFARPILDRLREYRQALITAAVTGQLPIPEAPTS